MRNGTSQNAAHGNVSEKSSSSVKKSTSAGGKGRRSRPLTDADMRLLVANYDAARVSYFVAKAAAAAMPEDTPYADSEAASNYSGDMLVNLMDASDALAAAIVDGREPDRTYTMSIGGRVLSAFIDRAGWDWQADESPVYRLLEGDANESRFVLESAV